MTTATRSKNGYHPNGGPPPAKEIEVPANVEAERAVLGAALIDPGTAMQLSSLLDAADFHRERHRWIYEAITHLAAQGIPAADYVTITDELERRGQLDGVGGGTYIIELTNATPTHIYADHYAKIVRQRAALRRAIVFAREITQLGYNAETSETDLLTTIEELRRKYLTPRRREDNLVEWKTSVTEYWDLLEARQRQADEHRRPFWPWAGFNQSFPHPPRGVLYQIAGDDGAGKTLVAECMADYWARDLGLTVVFVSMDMSRELMEDRRTCRHAGITYDRLRTGKLAPEEAQRLNLRTNDFLEWPGQIHYVYLPGGNVDEVTAAIDHAVDAYGAQVAVVDNANNLHRHASPRQMRLYSSAIDRQADNMNQLAACCGRNNIWTLVLNQLHKQGKAATSIEGVSKNDIEGSGNQTNVVRLNYSIWRGWVTGRDESYLDPSGIRVVTAKRGERSKFIWIRATKSTFGEEMTTRLIGEFEYYRIRGELPVEYEELED